MSCRRIRLPFLQLYVTIRKSLPQKEKELCMSTTTLTSLRVRLLVLIIAAVIPALVFIFYTASEQRNRREAEIREQTMRVAKLATNNIEQLVEGSHQLLIGLSKLPAIRNYDSSGCNNYFSAVKEQLPMYANIAAVKPNGDVFCSAIPIEKKINLADRIFFQSAMQDNGYSIGEYVIARVYEKPSFALGQPVLDRNQRVIAVIYVSLDLNWFKDQLSKIQVSDNAILTVLDRKQTILYRYPNTDKAMGQTLSGTELTKKIADLDEGIVVAKSAMDGITRIWAFNQVPGTNRSMSVRYGISREAAFADINRMLIKNLLILLIITGIVLIIAWFGGEYFIMRRMKLLTRATEELSKGNLSARVDIRGRQDEINQLGDSFNKMAESLERHIQERKKTEEQYRALFEESKDMIFMSTPQGKYLDINPAGVELLGYSSKEEVLDLDISRDIFVNSEDRKAYEQILKQKGFVKEYELEFKRKDGKQLTVLSTTTTLLNNNGDIVAYRGINRDITEHKRLEQQFIQAQKMEAVGQLSGGIAHDFNNILTAIIGYGSILKTKLPQSGFLHEYVNNILTSSEKAANLVKNLLAFSRKQILNPLPVDINTIVTGMQNILERIIGEDIEFTVKAADHDLIVKADKTQIEQVLMNLATNARDAMPSGGKLTISAAEVLIDERFIKVHQYGSLGTYAVISVTDTGIGIEKAALEHIFDPFFTTKEVNKGTGLGLAMVYGTIKQHDGFINVYSEPGIGTTFKLYLPLTAVPNQQIDNLPAASVSSGNETILLVEDNDPVRKVTRTILEEAGYKILEAASGKQAIECFRENLDKIDLVITDVIMPELSGHDVHSELQKIQPDVKIIYVSGYAADILEQKGMHNDTINFISKPLQPDVLLTKIREILS